MKYDAYGDNYADDDDVCVMLYKNPKLDFTLVNSINPDIYNIALKELSLEYDKLSLYRKRTESLEEYHHKNTSQWFMPQKYLDLDIAKYVLDLCKTEEELQRVGQELLLYQERNLFDLLRFLKYLVDTLRENKVVWGVGRGSSVSSYVLFLIGVHKINSLYYDLSIDEFFK
jgi:DNA polymerase III alpha subunit